MKKKKIKVIYRQVGSKEEQEERLSAAYDILFTEVARRMKKRNYVKKEASKERAR